MKQMASMFIRGMEQADPKLPRTREFLSRYLDDPRAVEGEE